MIWSLPARNDLAWGRRRPCVSEMSPMRSMTLACPYFTSLSRNGVLSFRLGLRDHDTLAIKWNGQGFCFHPTAAHDPPVLQCRRRGKFLSGTWPPTNRVEPVQAGPSLSILLPRIGQPACAARFREKGEVR